MSKTTKKREPKFYISYTIEISDESKAHKDGYQEGKTKILKGNFRAGKKEISQRVQDLLSAV